MTLADYPSQHRENRTIWRIFECLPLFAPLAGGRVFRWFAVNIPMDLCTGGGRFTSDIDIIACLRPFPGSISRSPVFKTWEVKVAVLEADGKVRSLKGGKTHRVVKQLNAYRDFGSPEVSLLDVFVCREGFFAANKFPSEAVLAALASRISELQKSAFGHLVLPFEQSDHGDGRDELKVITRSLSPLQTGIALLHPATTALAEPFARLARDLDDYFDANNNSQTARGRGWPIIVFCRRCRQLDILRTEEEYACSRCGVELALLMK